MHLLHVLGVLNFYIALLGPLKAGKNFSNMKKLGSGEQTVQKIPDLVF